MCPCSSVCLVSIMQQASSLYFYGWDYPRNFISFFWFCSLFLSLLSISPFPSMQKRLQGESALWFELRLLVVDGLMLDETEREKEKSLLGYLKGKKVYRKSWNLVLATNTWERLRILSSWNMSDRSKAWYELVAFKLNTFEISKETAWLLNK